jgi:hypothetical protein
MPRAPLQRRARGPLPAGRRTNSPATAAPPRGPVRRLPPARLPAMLLHLRCSRGLEHHLLLPGRGLWAASGYGQRRLPAPLRRPLTPRHARSMTQRPRRRHIMGCSAPKPSPAAEQAAPAARQTQVRTPRRACCTRCRRTAPRSWTSCGRCCRWPSSCPRWGTCGGYSCGAWPRGGGFGCLQRAWGLRNGAVLGRAGGCCALSRWGSAAGTWLTAAFRPIQGARRGAAGAQAAAQRQMAQRGSGGGGERCRQGGARAASRRGGWGQSERRAGA